MKYDDMTDREQCAYATGKQMAVETLFLRDAKGEDIAAGEYAEIVLGNCDGEDITADKALMAGFISEFMRFIGGNVA